MGAVWAGRLARFHVNRQGAWLIPALLGAAIMSPAFQELFNLNKGSIPVRLDVPLTKFDDCAKESNRDFVASSKSNTLLPSIAHGMAVPPARWFADQLAALD